MVHSARGVDNDGVLTVDIILSGDVPTLPDQAEIHILPVHEDYIQTGPGVFLSIFNFFIFLYYISSNYKMGDDLWNLAILQATEKRVLLKNLGNFG